MSCSMLPSEPLAIEGDLEGTQCSKEGSSKGPSSMIMQCFILMFWMGLLLESTKMLFSLSSSSRPSETIPKIVCFLK